MIKLSFIFVLFLMVVSCATTPVVLPEKYNLDNYLERVNRISIYKVYGYENIDNQSLIFNTDRNNFFLFVLRRPIDLKYSNLSMDIENSVARDKAYSTQEIVGAKSTARSGPGTDFVQAPSKMAGITAGLDRIFVKEAEDSAVKRYYVIEKIYRLNGREQAEEVKNLLRNN